MKRRVEDEANSQQPKGCTVGIQTPLSRKLFSFRVTFRIPVVRGKNLDIGSTHSRNPRGVVTRRGEGGGRGGARVDVSLVLMLIQVGKEPPL